MCGAEAAMDSGRWSGGRRGGSGSGCGIKVGAAARRRDRAVQGITGKNVV